MFITAGLIIIIDYNLPDINDTKEEKKTQVCHPDPDSTLSKVLEDHPVFWPGTPQPPLPGQHLLHPVGDFSS